MRQTILEKTNLKRLAKGHASAQRIGKSIGGYHVFPRQMAKTIPGPPLEKCGNWLLVGNNWMAALRGSASSRPARLMVIIRTRIPCSGVFRCTHAHGRLESQASRAQFEPSP